MVMPRTTRSSASRRLCVLAGQLAPAATEAEGGEPAELLVKILEEEHIAIVTLNAPERMNTISPPMLNELTKQIVQLNVNPKVRAVILTGAGDRAFCAGLNLAPQQKKGQNIQDLGSRDAPPMTNLDPRNTPPTVMHAMDKPLICAINGAAAGYGMDMALCCDIRFIDKNAKLSAAFVKRGIVPESGGTWLLPRLVGQSKAAEIIFGAETLSAEKCLEYGLVSKVSPPGAVMEDALAMARKIAANAPLAVQAAKRMMRFGETEGFADHVNRVMFQLLPLLQTKDSKEGMRAFMEKREPEFKGK